MIFMFDKWGLGRIPIKENGFNQDQKDQKILAHLLANQVS